MYEMPYKTYFSTKRILYEKTLQKKQWWLSTNLIEARAFNPYEIS